MVHDKDTRLCAERTAGVQSRVLSRELTALRRSCCKQDSLKVSQLHVGVAALHSRRPGSSRSRWRCITLGRVAWATCIIGVASCECRRVLYGRSAMGVAPDLGLCCNWCNGALAHCLHSPWGSQGRDHLPKAPWHRGPNELPLRRPVVPLGENKALLVCWRTGALSPRRNGLSEAPQGPGLLLLAPVGCAKRFN